MKTKRLFLVCYRWNARVKSLIQSRRELRMAAVEVRVFKGWKLTVTIEIATWNIVQRTTRFFPAESFSVFFRPFFLFVALWVCKGPIVEKEDRQTNKQKSVLWRWRRITEKTPKTISKSLEKNNKECLKRCRKHKQKQNAEVVQRKKTRMNWLHGRVSIVGEMLRIQRYQK